MSDETSCKALAAALQKKGWDHNKLATELGEPEDLLTGDIKPTPEEFKKIATVLGITSVEAPHDSAHATAPA
ncbi:hypothetical protein BDV93DRAFT_558953 [Ceratobasidium sp. AG-I]|nr:hypothetical protein BDV93DRAFT_558953 [Ceratobasidium sp. AG-I]